MQETGKDMHACTFKTAGDLEHSQIIQMYTEENMGMKDIAEKLHRSSARERALTVVVTFARVRTSAPTVDN